MSIEEAKMIICEHERFLRAEGEYYFTFIPPYTIEEVAMAKKY